MDTNTKNKNKIMPIERQELDKLLSQRINFAFDSLYFRYAMAIDELARYKEEENRRNGSCANIKRWADSQKMQFYKVLDEILEPYPKENNQKSSGDY